MSRPRRRRRGTPTELGTVLPRVLGELGLDGAAAALRVSECWADAVGAEIALHCQPLMLRGGVLEAAVDSSVWCQQIQLQVPEILEALRQRMGDEAPTMLRLRIR